MFDHILARIAGPHNDLIYIGKNYTLADLERDLRLLECADPAETTGPGGIAIELGLHFTTVARWVRTYGPRYAAASTHAS